MSPCTTVLTLPHPQLLMQSGLDASGPGHVVDPIATCLRGDVTASPERYLLQGSRCREPFNDP